MHRIQICSLPLQLEIQPGCKHKGENVNFGFFSMCFFFIYVFKPTNVEPLVSRVQTGLAALKECAQKRNTSNVQLYKLFVTKLHKIK